MVLLVTTKRKQRKGCVLSEGVYYAGAHPHLNHVLRYRNMERQQTIRHPFQYGSYEIRADTTRLTRRNQ